MFEELRIRRRPTRVRCRIPLATAILRIPKRLARALTRDAAPTRIPTRHPHLHRTRAVEVHQASRGAASPSFTSPRHHQYREVVPVDQAHIIKIKPLIAVEGELGKGRRRDCAGTGALDLARAAIGGGAGEFSGGVVGAEGPGPEPTRPGIGRREGPGLAALEGEAGGGEHCPVGAR